MLKELYPRELTFDDALRASAPKLLSQSLKNKYNSALVT